MSTEQQQAAAQEAPPTDAEFEEVADFIEKMMQWAFNVTGLRRPTKILMIGTMVAELRAIKARAIQSALIQAANRTCRHCADGIELIRDPYIAHVPPSQPSPPLFCSAASIHQMIAELGTKQEAS